MPHPSWNDSVVAIDGDVSRALYGRLAKRSAPELHFGSTEKDGSLSAVLADAVSAVTNVGLTVNFDPERDERTPVVIGSSPDVVVIVACGAIDPTHSWVMVAASSTDSSRADEFRDKVRTAIERTHFVDHCEPGSVPYYD